MVTKRILYLDLMRAFAVFMMVQGHTIDSLLSDDYRTLDSLVYSIWHSMRGFTAPIFMFTSGVVFTYLLKKSERKQIQSDRIRKGIKRGIVLIVIGYLLRYPAFSVFDFSNVSHSQWLIFFSVDALHIIGLGLLIIISLYSISKYFKLETKFILLIFSIIVLLASPFINSIDWSNSSNIFLSSYFTKSFGSIFTFFPWIAYMTLGSLLGLYIESYQGIFLKKRFAFSLAAFGLGLLLVSLIFKTQFAHVGEYSTISIGFFTYRLGVVLLLNALISFVAARLKSVPKIISIIGKHTLPIYVVHLIILYGCAWTPGLYRFLKKSFTTSEALASALVMILMMISLVLVYEKLKIVNWKKLVRSELKG